MPLDLPDYKDLNSMYSGPLAARMAQDNYDQKGRLAQMLIQQQQQTNDDNAVMNPLKQMQQAGIVQDQQARLPGLVALSRNHQLTTDKAERTHEAEIDDLMRTYKSVSADELSQLTRSGEAYGQVGSYLDAIPGPARSAAAKQMLGGFWRPEFDTIPPDQLSSVLKNAGTWMTSAQTKYQQAMQKQDDAQAARLKEIETKAAAAKALAGYKESIKKVTAKAEKSNDPKNWQEAATRLRNAASLEEDDEKRAALTSRAQEFEALIFLKERQKAAAAAETKPDPNKFGIETNAPVPIPQVPVTSSKPTAPTKPATGNNPVMNDPNMSKLPQGTKALGNGIYQLPDGRKVKAN